MTIETPIVIRPAGEDWLDLVPDLGGYRVVDVRHGTAVYGLVPMSHLEGLQKTWEAAGYTIWDLGVASALGATIAATNPDGSKAWRAEIEEQVAKVAGDDAELRWALGCDTGRSAAVILYVLGSSLPAQTRAASIIHRPGGQLFEGAIPHDAADLGRCIRLLDLFPAWRERLGEVAENIPDWSPLVRQWVELEALYRRELPGGRCPLTDAMMRALGEESRGVPESTVDLSGPDAERWPEEAALWVVGEREGLYFDAVDDVLEAMIDHHEELPERLYVGIPPGPGARVLLWSRRGEDATVERAVRNAGARTP